VTVSRRSFALGLAAVPVAVPVLSRAALADDTVRCTIGLKDDWDTMVVQHGIDQGFFKKAGLNVVPTYTEGGSDTIQIVATGTADIGIATGITAAIGAFAHGAPIKILNAEMTGASDNYWYVEAESPIKTMADMNGKSMAYSRFGSTTYLTTKMLAAQAKVTPTFVATGAVSPTRTLVMSGQVDAGWAAAPYNFDLIKEKKIRILAHASDVAELRTRTMRVNVVSSAFLASQPSVVARFVKAYEQAVNWMYTDPKALAVFAGWNGFDIDTARETLKYFPRQSLATMQINGLAQSVQDALEFKSITAPLTADQMRDIIAVVPNA
jgi:NitT/TauT family transport system substrate-binding protein